MLQDEAVAKAIKQFDADAKMGEMQKYQTDVSRPLLARST
jgi:hypothetical protein